MNMINLYLHIQAPEEGSIRFCPYSLRYGLRKPKMKLSKIKKEEEEEKEDRDRPGTNEMDKDEVERWYPS